MSEWIKTAKVGDRVVCINDRPHAFCPPGFIFTHEMNGLRAGGNYSLREIFVDRAGDVCFKLNEIYRFDAGRFWDNGEAGYDARRFKPIAPQQKSIDALRAIAEKPFADLPERERVLELWKAG